MKLFYIVPLIILQLFTNVSITDPINQTAELIKTGNVPELVKSFSSTIDLTILSEENIYSRSQAGIILEGFFKAHPPRAVKIFHRVSTNPNYRFAVLILTTANGTFRTSISLKLSNGAFILDELRIESEKTK